MFYTYICNERIRFSLKPQYNHSRNLYRVRLYKIFFQPVLISWMVTLSSCLIWQIIRFVLPPNWFWHKNHLFRWCSFWSWRVCKFSHLGHIKPAPIHWKADAPKTGHCWVRILVQRHNWAIFLRKWARRGRYSQWRPLSGHVEWIFVHKNWRGEYWQHLVSTERRYVPHSRS